MARGGLLGIGAAVALALAPACSPPSSSGGAPRGELRINLATEPPTLDWTLATDTTSFLLLEQLMRGLTRMGPDLRPTPALATRWEVSDGGRVYTFHLRRDVRWSDGVPLHAEQFVYAWRRLLDPATAAEYAYFLYPVKNARSFNAGELDDPALVGVRALDAHTLRVELEAPLVYFPSLTTFMVTFPGRRDLVERHGSRWTEPEHMATLGAFRLEEWRHEYKVVLGANPEYYGPPPALRRITGYMVDMDSTALVLYEQGLLDLVRLPALEIRRYRERADYRTRPMLRGYYYGFNTTRPPFDDVRVRRALAMAIDRRVFPRVLQGGEIPSGSWLPPGMPHHNAAIGLPFDPVRARALLSEAGVDPAEIPPVRVVYNTDQTNKLVAETVQAQWREHLGLRVELENREWKVFLKELVNDTPPVYRLGWGADFPDPDNFMNLFTSTSANNHTGWGDPRYDRLIGQAARETDPSRRQALYDEAQRILCEEQVPIIPFFVSALNMAVAPRVEGFETNAMDIYFLDRVRAN
jgi:oligopeptide transport system substrate-binding protein